MALLARIRRFTVRARHQVERSDRPVHVFHHIAKTGGVSVRQALAHWFYLVPDYARRKNRADFWSERIEPEPIDLSTLKRNDCLVGHWPDGMWDRYPALTLDRFRVFTFLRDPLDLQLSLYHWEIRKGKEPRPMHDELLSRPNFQATFIGATADNWRDVLGRYDFIGLTGRLQGSMDALALLYGKPRIRIGHSNATPRPKLDLPRGFLAEFRAANTLDYRLYNHATLNLEGLWQ